MGLVIDLLSGRTGFKVGDVVDHSWSAAGFQL